MAEKKYSYLVDTRWPFPRLVRASVLEGFQLFVPGNPDRWENRKSLDALGWGGGDSVWYDDITEEEAMKYMDEIRESAWNAANGKG